MFTKAKNIDRSFRHIRLFTLVVVVACLVLTLFVLYSSFRLVAQRGEKIYVLAGGKALEAFATDRRENIPVEARDHVRTFHQYFFTLDPDEKVIESNLARALYLADGSAKKQYDNLRENSYYAGIIAGNISQEIHTDSVQVDVSRYPFYFRYYGTQRIIRPLTIVHRSLITEGYLRTVSRSENNAHGFLIEKWATLENRDLKTEKR